MLSVKDSISHFYKSNKDFLEATYPGLQLSRLENEFRTILERKGKKLNFSSSIHPFVEQELNLFQENLKKGIPLEYLSGVSFFYQSEFLVTSEVLIPRNETELLVEMSVNELKTIDSEEPLQVVEVGVGSGAISLSILLEVERPIELIATDISKEALEVAKKNAFLLSFNYSKEHRIEFKETDRLHGVDGEKDLIISNPPYIKSSEDKHKVHQQTDCFEPHLALYLEDNVYESWFVKFFEDSLKLLKSDGRLLMEGHEDHLKKLSKLAEQVGFQEVSIAKDYTNRERFLIALK